MKIIKQCLTFFHTNNYGWALFILSMFLCVQINKGKGQKVKVLSFNPLPFAFNLLPVIYLTTFIVPLLLPLTIYTEPDIEVNGISIVPALFFVEYNWVPSVE